jgi:hypothetical protein
MERGSTMETFLWLLFWIVLVRVSWITWTRAGTKALYQHLSERDGPAPTPIPKKKTQQEEKRYWDHQFAFLQIQARQNRLRAQAQKEKEK